MYTRVTSAIIKYHKDDLSSYAKVENLGLQLVWKGAEILFLPGSTFRPCIVMILLRSGWKISAAK